MTIHIDTSYRKLSDLVEDPRYVETSAVHLLRAATVIGEANARGLVYRGEVYGAATMVIGGADRLSHSIERRVIYALAPIGREISAVAPMIDAIIAAHGPGDWWTVGRPIGHIADDGKIPSGDIDGVQHVLLRSIYFHAPAAGSELYRQHTGEITGLTDHIPETTP